MTVCARCGTPLEDDMRFCIECGQAVGPARAPVSAAGRPEEAAACAEAAAPAVRGAPGRPAGFAAGAKAGAARLTRGGVAIPESAAAGAVPAPGESSPLAAGPVLAPHPAPFRSAVVPVTLLKSWQRMRWLRALTVFAVLCVVGASVWFGWKHRPAEVRVSGAAAAPAAPPASTAVELSPSGAASGADLLETEDGAAADAPHGGAGNGRQESATAAMPPAPGLAPASVATPPAQAPSPQPSSRPRTAAAAGAGEKAAEGGSWPVANTPGSAGSLVWTGRLRPGSVVVIDGDHVTTGSLRGALPGVPVVVETPSSNVRLTEMPGPANGWKRIAFEGLRDQNAVVTLHWRLF